MEEFRMKKILSIMIFILCCFPICSHAAWYDAEFEELKARNFINEVHFQNPDTPILREEICDILISLYKYQNPDCIIEEKANTFTDVQGSAYSSSIASAYSLGMIQGVSDTEFQGKGTLTREQFATIVYRMHGSPMAPVRLYRDEPEISDYAISGIDYCVQQGIVKGTQKDFFSPKKALTKAEALAMVNRICKLENSVTKENAQLTTTVIEDSVAVYNAIPCNASWGRNDNGLEIIDKSSGTREWLPLTCNIVGHLFDLGDRVLIPKASEIEKDYSNYKGIYILDKKTHAVSEYNSPELYNVWAYYNNGLYFISINGTARNIARYDLKTGEITIGDAVSRSYFNEDHVKASNGNKVYAHQTRYEHKRDTEIEASAVYEIDLDTLTKKEYLFPDVGEFNLVSNKYIGYDECINNGGSDWTHYFVIRDIKSGNIIKKVNLNQLFNAMPYNNDKSESRYTVKTSFWYYPYCIDGEIYILEDGGYKLICVTNPDMFSIDVSNYFYYIKYGKEKEFFVFDVLRDYIKNKDCAYSSIYTREFFSDGCDVGEDFENYKLLREHQKSYWQKYLNPYDLVNAVNYYLTHSCTYDYVAWKNRGNPIYKLAYSKFGVIKYQKIVCQGYAEYFSAILDYADIPVCMLTGNDHAWNMIYLDGKYYFFDCTVNSNSKNENAYAWFSAEQSYNIPSSEHAGYLPN